MNTIPALLQKAKDSLHAARLLATEHLYDFAVSRAYYAMHYVAQAFLLSQRINVTDPEGVAEAFGQRFAHTGVLPPIFHRWLMEAAALRRRADYETATGLTTLEVADQLDRARAFVSLGREELAEQPR